MKPLIVLLGVFLGALITIKIGRDGYDYLLSAGIAMSVMLLFTAVGHFKFAQGMSMMLHTECEIWSLLFGACLAGSVTGNIWMKI